MSTVAEWHKVQTFFQELGFYCFATPIPRCRATANTNLNDLKNSICLRKSEVSVERISDYNVIETLAYTVCHAPIQMTS